MNTLNYVLAAIAAILGIACLVLFFMLNTSQKDLAECQADNANLKSAIDIQNITIQNNAVELDKANKKLKEKAKDVAKSFKKIEVPNDTESQCAIYVKELMDSIYKRRRK